MSSAPEISEAAQVARERLHEEIERVRLGVEEMLDEQENGHPNGNGKSGGSDLRRELEELRIDTRDYVKKKVRKSEKKMARSMRELDARADRLERRIDEVESDRVAAEVRIHQNTERMLDGLLVEVKAVADRLGAQPAPAPKPRAVAPQRVPARPKAAPQPPRKPAPQGPVGRIGPRPR